MTNVLYFEGAGMDYEINNDSNVGNYRIRTAFKNDEGIEYYIELGRSPRYDYSGKKAKIMSEWALRIDHLFKIEDKTKFSEGQYEIVTDWKAIQKFSYMKEDIVKWINDNLNCSFDTIEVLDRFYGYHVHANKGKYSLMEDIELNHKRAAARKQAYKEIDDEYKNICNSKYSVISLLEMVGDKIKVRCHAGSQSLGDYPRIKEVIISY